ncbi:MAG: DHH family phosphoesterase [Lachnospiraceae bacterium]|nr:DHH family phosphoesterase [Ruminococcus sp.]MCM1273950.1 DHH family phosphoesterase [Lachnospiraceae bacterium]
MKNFYKSNVLLAAVGTLIIMLIVIDVYVFRREPLMFWVSLPILLGVSGLALGKLLQIRQSEYWYFEQLSEEIRSTDSMSLISFPLPICVVDEERSVIWSNNCFNDTFFTPSEDESSINPVTDMPLELFGLDGREIGYGENWFRVYSVVHDFAVDSKIAGKPVIFGAESGGEAVMERITMLIFRDITDLRRLQVTHEMSKPVVMIVMVDNYEELLSGAKESERAYVTIQVDRLIEEYFAEKKAVLKKMTGDKFLIVLEQQYLNQMIKDKMALINKAHEIIVRDRAAVTLSIGVGATASSLAEGERFASEMLDKALERGGDQALVKTSNGFDAFGAISPGKERTGKVKIRLAAEEIKSLISTADTVYIMGHSFGDFDSAGSAIGLTCAIRRLGIPAYTVARFRDSSKTNAKALFDRFVDYDTPVVIEPEEARQWITPKSVLIIVDTHITKKLEDAELFELAQKNRVVIIDHHRLSAGAITEFAVRCHESNASSASELVTELIQYFGSGALIKPLEAEALLAGITLDTKDFVMRSGVSTFEAAAYLKKIGADTIAVKKLFDTTIESKTKKSQIISSAKIYRARCAISVVEESFEGIRVLCSQAADEMLYIRNVDASFTVYPIENGWSISARSLGKVNVQVIMESLGNKIDDGGGHQSMAGAQLYGITVEETLDRLHGAIDEYFTAAPKDKD